MSIRLGVGLTSEQAVAAGFNCNLIHELIGGAVFGVLSNRPVSMWPTDWNFQKPHGHVGQALHLLFAN
jgi:hypothetical protein